VHFLFQNDKPFAKDRFPLHNRPSNYTTKIKRKLHMNTQIMLMKAPQQIMLMKVPHEYTDHADESST
jgi:hypothetical protein